MRKIKWLPEENGSIALPYWVRVALWIMLPAILILMGLERGPGAEDGPALINFLGGLFCWVCLIQGMHP